MRWLRTRIMRRRILKPALVIVAIFSLLCMISNIFVMEQYHWFGETIGTYASRKLDPNYLSVRTFLTLQWRQLRKQDDLSDALRRQNEAERITGNAYSLDSDSDLEIDRNKLLWVWPIEKNDWISKILVYNHILIRIRTYLMRQDRQNILKNKKTDQESPPDNHIRDFQRISNDIFENRDELKIAFLYDAISLLRLSKEPTIISIFLGWQRNREEMNEDYFGINRMEEENGNLFANGYYRYYPCTVSGTHYEYTKSRVHGGSANTSYTCQENTSALATPSVNFDPHYFTYHAMRHNLVIRTRGGRDIETTKDEWDLTCMHCHKYPNFMTYTHVIHEALLDPNGVVYIRNLKIIPLMWVDQKPTSPENPNMLTGAYRYRKGEHLFTVEEPLYNVPDLSDVSTANVLLMEEIFSISVRFSSQNFGHALLESFTRLSVYVPFLKINPHIPIHTGNPDYLQRFMKIYELKNSLISGFVIAKRVFLPEGNAPYFPSVHYLQSTSYYIRKYVKSIQMNTAVNNKQDTIIYVKRSTRRPLKQDVALDIFLEDLAKQNNLRYERFGDEFSQDGNRNVNDTVLLFNKAVLVIGAHGAGLSNILFSQPNTSIIEIQCPAPWTASTFRHVSYKLGMRFHSVMGHPLDGLDPLSGRPSTVHCDKGLKIHNMDSLKRTISEMLMMTLSDVRRNNDSRSVYSKLKDLNIK